MTVLSRPTILLPVLLVLSGCRSKVAAPAVENSAAEAPTAPAAAGANSTASATPSEITAPATSPATRAHPCLVQDDQPVRVAPVRAVGTEPFWGVRTQGRCVTYSTPEDQAGTRVWAKVESGADGRVWTGALRGKPFRLSIQPMPGCSDGMSDNRYPLEAKVLVDGEERRGCAEPTGR